jgi:hypothetical protein
VRPQVQSTAPPKNKKKNINKKGCEMIHAKELTVVSFGEGSRFGGVTKKES